MNKVKRGRGRIVVKWPVITKNEILPSLAISNVVTDIFHDVSQHITSILVNEVAHAQTRGSIHAGHYLPPKASPMATLA